MKPPKCNKFSEILQRTDTLPFIRLSATDERPTSKSTMKMA